MLTKKNLEIVGGYLKETYGLSEPAIVKEVKDHGKVAIIEIGNVEFFLAESDLKEGVAKVEKVALKNSK